MYSLEVEVSCKEAIRKKCRKNKLLEKAISNKMKHVLEAPRSFDPLHAPLEGKFHVHVLTSFVLIYDVDETRKVVRLLRFAHHDDAY